MIFIEIFPDQATKHCAAKHAAIDAEQHLRSARFLPSADQEAGGPRVGGRKMAVAAAEMRDAGGSDSFTYTGATNRSAKQLRPIVMALYDNFFVSQSAERPTFASTPICDNDELHAMRTVLRAAVLQ